MSIPWQILYCSLEMIRSDVAWQNRSYLLGIDAALVQIVPLFHMWTDMHRKIAKGKEAIQVCTWITIHGI